MIKIKFTDFWSDFNKQDNFFTRHLLNDLFKYELVESDPDILIYSLFGNDNYNYTCKKIFYTGENFRPLSSADLNLGYDYTSDNNERLPMHIINYYGQTIHHYPGSVGKDTSILFDNKVWDKSKRNKFCAFIYSNGDIGSTWWGVPFEGVRKRNTLFNFLNMKKKVDAPGLVFHNTGDILCNDKIEFLKEYKFAFAFENSSYPGYVTEKISDVMLGGAIPIYYGSPRIVEEYNPASFINYHNYENYKDIVDYILYLDSNDKAYAEVYNQPYCLDKDVFNLDRIREKIKQLI